ncbi:MAG: hypothetical protein R3C43_19210 [Chloroflexota bacterium]
MRLNQGLRRCATFAQRPENLTELHVLATHYHCRPSAILELKMSGPRTNWTRPLSRPGNAG